MAALASETERIAEPELFLNDRLIEHPSGTDKDLILTAIATVREAESSRGLPLCVTRIESSYVDAHPEAVRLAVLSAVTTLLDQK